jgi:hypothetical protein
MGPFLGKKSSIKKVPISTSSSNFESMPISEGLSKNSENLADS